MALIRPSTFVDLYISSLSLAPAGKVKPNDQYLIPTASETDQPCPQITSLHLPTRNTAANTPPQRRDVSVGPTLPRLRSLPRLRRVPLLRGVPQGRALRPRLLDPARRSSVEEEMAMRRQVREVPETGRRSCRRLPRDCVLDWLVDFHGLNRTGLGCTFAL